MWQGFMARQLARPSGWFGRFFTARWLDQANAGMNAMILAQLALISEDRLLEIGFGGGALLAAAGYRDFVVADGRDGAQGLIHGVSANRP